MDRPEICAAFLDTLQHALYPFQEEALLAWFECEGGLLVTAPTGMGKTLIAEAALYEALASGRRAYYTSPLIALTDQKFREFQDAAERWGFARDEVGLVTGNRKVNPDARVKVVVAEILLNHLLAGEVPFDQVDAVVMDEFHWFNDPERGIVWELALVLLPKSVRLMLLSATVGNAWEFTLWLKEKHGRALKLCESKERKVALEFHWVEDRLMSEQLPAMVAADDASSRVPALVFCFNRDECWEVAEQLKGLPLIDAARRAEIEDELSRRDLRDGIGPKLQQMLIRGVGVHHAGVLPRFKEIVEALFLRKLVPFVICTETLAAGVNLPARSVVLSTLIQGPRGGKKLIPSASAHQMFGRAGRPQFDVRGYVFVLAHEDDVRIFKWKQKAALLDSASKDLGILKARKELERKRPSRRKTEQYWTEGQLQGLIKAGPAKLASRSMIPYQALIWLLSRSKDQAPLALVRRFLAARFDSPERLARFQDQLDRMIANLEACGLVKRGEDPATIAVEPALHELLSFRSIDPLYGAFLGRILAGADVIEKAQALESVLPLPPRIVRVSGDVSDGGRGPGPLQTGYLEPLMTALGVKLAPPPPDPDAPVEDDFDPWKEEEEKPPGFPDMLKIAFEKDLPFPEDLPVQAKWVAGGVLDAQDDFHRFVKSHGLQKNEGLVFRHLLRFVILAGEFFQRTGDPDYQDLAARATAACRAVDPSYTERYLASEDEAPALA